MIEANWNDPAVMAKIREGAMRGVVSGVGILEQNWLDLILKGTKSGRVYHRRGVTHRASAPGEAPASDTGRLVNSRRIDLLPDELAATFTVSTLYALMLELGTIKMEPRPHGRPALEMSRAAIEAGIEGEIRAALR